MSEFRERGDHKAVISMARACLQLDPLNGEATFALAESLALVGQRADALGVLDHYRLERQANDEETRRATGALRRRIIDSARRPPARALQEIPLIGRSAILGEVSAWMVNSGDPTRICTLVGEAGIGKTRLLNEIVRVGTVHGIRVVEYRPSAVGRERPLAGLFDLLPQLLALPGAVGCSPPSFTRLNELARGVQSESSIPEDRSDSVFRFATLRRSVLDLVEAVLGEGEVLIVVDDAHALDRPTVDILVDATRCTGNRLALLAAMRPVEPRLPLAEKRTDVRVIRVPLLQPADARSMLIQGVGPRIAAERSELLDWAVDLANGNPFFLVELASHCRGDNPNDSLPESMQIVLDRKIEALTHTSRHILQSCAVLSDYSTLARLETLLGLPPHVMASGLSELENSGLVTLRDRSVVCRHDLIAEAVQRSLSSTLGSYLNRRSASVLDTELQTAPSASLAWDCARHWDAAEEHDRALEVTAQIVDQLLALGLPQEAAELCSRAERYCRTPEQRADRLFKMSRAHRLVFDWDGVISSLGERRALLAGNSKYEARYSEDEILLLEARWWRTCDSRVLRPAMKRVLDTRAPLLHRLQMAVLALIVADNFHRRSEAQRIADVVESLDALGPREDIERCKARLIYHTGFGSLDEARDAGVRLVEAERRAGNSTAYWRALRWLSVPRRFIEPELAIDDLRQAYREASRLNLRGEMWNAASCAIGVAFEYENVALALEWAPIIESLAEAATPHPLRAVEHYYMRARVEHMQGDLAQARIHLDQSGALKNGIRGARGEQSILALDVLLRVQSGEKHLPRATLRRLRLLHLRTRGSGFLDFETAALLAGLLHSGDRAEARSLHDSYMSLRRVRTDRHPVLRSVQARL
jgi:hypothetical protein